MILADQHIKLDEAIHNASTCNEIRESLLGHTTEKEWISIEEDVLNKAIDRHNCPLA